MIAFNKLKTFSSDIQYKKKSPFIKGIVLKNFKMNPKKPNSANRTVVKVKCHSKGKLYTAFVPGEGPHNLFQHSVVLIKWGKTKDLPGVRLKVVLNKYDCPGVHRKSSFSKYGFS